MKDFLFIALCAVVGFTGYIILISSGILEIELALGILGICVIVLIINDIKEGGDYEERKTKQKR